MKRNAGQRRYPDAISDDRAFVRGSSPLVAAPPSAPKSEDGQGPMDSAPGDTPHCASGEQGLRPYDPDTAGLRPGPRRCRPPDATIPTPECQCIEQSLWTCQGTFSRWSISGRSLAMPGSAKSADAPACRGARGLAASEPIQRTATAAT